MTRANHWSQRMRANRHDADQQTIRPAIVIMSVGTCNMAKRRRAMGMRQ